MMSRSSASLTARLLPLLLAFSLACSAMPTVAAGTVAEVTLDSVRADRLDLDNDGDSDLLRIVHLVNTSETWASVGVEVIATHDDLSLSFWENFTVNSSVPHLGSIDVSAWSDGEYDLTVRVWDNEMEVLRHEELLGAFDLVASLSPPLITLALEAPPNLLTGEPCTIHRTFSDEVGEHYDALGTISMSGVPWLVPSDVEGIDCSGWPAGEYRVVERYQNGLGFHIEESISFAIENHPAPQFDLVSNGSNGRLGEACTIDVVPLGDTNLIGTTIEWDVIDARNDPVSMPVDPSLNCTMWAPGLHKVRITLTSPQGQETTQGLNVIRVPPSSADINLFNETESANWPSHSEGEDFQPEPMMYNAAASTAVVGGSGVVLAVLLGLFAGLVVTRRKSSSYDETYGDALGMEEGGSLDGGLSTYTDPEGIVWRQHPDGSMDWYDEGTGNWIRYEA